MGRLIDADAFEKFIKEKYKDGESTDDIKDQMLFDLSYQPTAYDAEKVVEESKEISKWVAYNNHDRDIGMTHRVVPFEALEKIVRKGGVE